MIKIEGNSIVKENGEVIESFHENGNGTITYTWKSTGVSTTVKGNLNDCMWNALLYLTTAGYGGLLPLDEQWQKDRFAKLPGNVKRACYASIAAG